MKLKPLALLVALGSAVSIGSLVGCSSSSGDDSHGATSSNDDAGASDGGSGNDGSPGTADGGRKFDGGDSGPVDAGPPGTEFAASTHWPVPVVPNQLGAYSPNGGSADNVNGDVANWTVLDMDGDGKVDFVETAVEEGGNPGEGIAAMTEVPGYGTATPHWNVFLGQSAGFSTTATSWSVPTLTTNTYYGYGLYVPNFELSGAVAGNGQVGNWYTFDINGDGYQDLVVTSIYSTAPVGMNVPGLGTASPHWNVYLGSKTGFASAATAWPVPALDTTAQGVNNYHGGSTLLWSATDVNGDGLLDLIVTAGNTEQVLGYGASPHWDLYLGGKTGFATTATTWSVPTIPNANGLIGLTGGGTANNGDISSWTTMDMNNDGKVDLVVTSLCTGHVGYVPGIGASPYWNIYAGGSSGFAATATQWAVPTIPNAAGLTASTGGDTTSGDIGVWRTLDINGDGKLDLVATAIDSTPTAENVPGLGSSPHWNTYLGGTAGFAPTATSWNVPTIPNVTGLNNFNSQVNTGVNGDYGVWSTMDINGDNRLDLVVSSVITGGSQDVPGPAPSPYWLVFLNAP